MSEINNTLKSKKNQYHHLTQDDRNKIEALVNQKDEKGKRLFNNTYIANYLGVNKSTISWIVKDSLAFVLKATVSSCSSALNGITSKQK